jgi:glycyl-tRNA synthetase beta chain
VRADLPARQADREEIVWGPALKVAKDPSGAWTGAAQGFAKKNQTTPDALATGAKDPAKPSDLYLRHVVRTAGRPAAEVLPGVISAVLRALQLPKRMSWDAWLDDGKGAFPFARPIRWMVATLDGAVVPFAIRALVDGRPGDVVVQAGILDPVERETAIRAQLGKAGGLAGAEAHGLVPEWRDLVEFPTVLTGEIPAEFRALPVEVLETVLVHHQKYAPVAEGGHVARFAALVNTDGAHAAEIVRGMQRVVVARRRGPQAPAGGAGRGPGGRHLPPRPRHLPREVRPARPAGVGTVRGHAGRGRAGRGGGGRAAGQGRPHHAHGARVP